MENWLSRWAWEIFLPERKNTVLISRLSYLIMEQIIERNLDRWWSSKHKRNSKVRHFTSEWNNFRRRILYFYSEFSNKSGVEINVELGHYFHLCRWKNVELGLFFICEGEKTWSWENFLKKNKKNSTLIREFRVSVKLVP